MMHAPATSVALLWANDVMPPRRGLGILGNVIGYKHVAPLALGSCFCFVSISMALLWSGNSPPEGAVLRVAKGASNSASDAWCADFRRSTTATRRAHSRTSARGAPCF